MFIVIEYLLMFCSLTLLLERLDDLTNSLQLMLVCYLCRWPLESSIATHILDSGFLVDLTLQVLEDALSEEGVDRHDVWFVFVLCVVDSGFRAVQLVAEVGVDLQKVRWSSRQICP
jgi:hypothetical protein